MCSVSHMNTPVMKAVYPSVCCCYVCTYVDVESFQHNELVALLKTPSIKVDVTDEVSACNVLVHACLHACVSACVCVRCPLQTGMTPLMHAAYKGNLDACETLLKHGADVNCNLHEHCVSGALCHLRIHSQKAPHHSCEPQVLCCMSHLWLCSTLP